MYDGDIETVKDMLVDLQKYVVEIDKYQLNILADDYREKYFDSMVFNCSQNQGKIFVCESAGQVFGMIAGGLEAYCENDRLCYSCPKKGIVYELIVKKDKRHFGAGKMLLNAMEEYFKSIGCEYIQIDVFSYNEPAKRFYYNQGYEDRMLSVFKKV